MAVYLLHKLNHEFVIFLVIIIIKILNIFLNKKQNNVLSLNDFLLFV